MYIHIRCYNADRLIWAWLDMNMTILSIRINGSKCNKAFPFFFKKRKYYIGTGASTLNFLNSWVRACLYGKQNRDKKQGLYVDFCKRNDITSSGETLSLALCPVFLGMELHKWFHKFFRLVEIVNKASLQDSIFKFNSIFLALFIKFICQIKYTSVF